MIKTLRSLQRRLVPAACFALMAVAAPAATSVTQFGITWTFDRDYPTGQFANGDYWVVGPVTLTGITPRSTTVDGVTMHGSVINPVPSTTQGFDSRIKNNAYDATRNVARSFPLTVPAGSSILSAESHLALAAGNDAQLKTIAVLTVVATAPAPGSFRPPYAGTDKTIRWNKQQLDYSKLRSLPVVASTPALSTVEALFEKPFIDLRSSWAGTYLQPSSNHPSYGREISHQVGSGLLSLQLDYTPAQKETLLVRLVQRGLDVYGLAAVGGNWHNDGGHRHGRKPMLLLAGTVLNDPAILAYADAQKAFIFQEDHQMFYVSMEDVLRPRKTSDGRYREPYTEAMIGTPEWGGKHKGEPEGDAAQWDAPYRSVCGASTVGTVLAARLMGLESTWNWPALFDYIDRYWRVEGHLTTTGTNAIQPFVKSMWNAYRLSTPPPLTPEDVVTESWASAPFSSQAANFTLTFDAMASKTDMDGIAGPSAGVVTALGDLAAAVRFSPTGFIQVRNGTGYGADAVMSYTAGVLYRVVMSVDLSTRRYSVVVTPQGGTAIKLAADYAFTTGQISTFLDHVSFYASNGALAVTSVSATTIEPPPAPEPEPEPPTTVDPDEVWGSVNLGDRSGTFTVAYTLMPTKASVSGGAGLGWGAVSSETDLIAALRLTPEGIFQALNGTTYAAATKLSYQAGVSYHVSLSVDLPRRKYTATVTPAGAKSGSVIARNYALPAGVTKINTLHHYSVSGEIGFHAASSAAAAEQPKGNSK
jgi:hypothetical protein